AVEVIKKCIEMGADQGVLLSDRAFAGSDTLATSYILSTAVQKLMKKGPFNLVMCGKQAIDGDTAQVGPGIASRLKIPQLTYIERIIGIDIKEYKITVHRKLDDGYEVIESTLPCLLTIEKDINELSYSPLPDMIKAAKFSPAVWEAKDLDVDHALMGLKGSPTAVRKIFPPAKRCGGEILKGSVTDNAKLITDTLKGEILKCRS
ncbi:MAG TPA: electron transfer flavoprotein subunit beta/FixA family protein, partial [Caproiciproducens sp.]|nr:electron transfer flavoprotein subunit beta/FixA family protein [Caproiciproducens sp.]